MPLAAFEPGKDMAIANFLLAIFCLFTIALPLLLITRGDKAEANRDFLVATFNPWSRVIKKPIISTVILTDITSSIKQEPNLKTVLEESNIPISESEEFVSLEIKGSNELDESLAQLPSTHDELLAA